MTFLTGPTYTEALDGELLDRCLAAYPQLRACLYEPTPALRSEATAKLSKFEKVRIVGDLTDLKERRFDLIFSLEVFEHLPENETDAAIAAIDDLTKPGDRVVIGVPHEVFLRSGIFLLPVPCGIRLSQAGASARAKVRHRLALVQSGENSGAGVQLRGVLPAATTGHRDSANGEALTLRLSNCIVMGGTPAHYVTAGQRLTK